MRISLIRLFICLALGVAINVLLAWALASTGDSRGRTIYRGDTHVLPYVPSGFPPEFGDRAPTPHPDNTSGRVAVGYVAIDASSQRGGHRFNRGFLYPGSKDQAPVQYIAPHGFKMREVRAGWPMLSMVGRLEGEIDGYVLDTARVQPNYPYPLRRKVTAVPFTARTVPFSLPSFSIGRYTFDFTEMPTHPAMIGFAVNTAIYSLAVAVPLIALPWAWWRCVLVRRRRNRGQCVWCGYEAKSRDACPECGRATPPSQPRA